MFFSTELLSKRDGGFGLLWCAIPPTAPNAFSCSLSRYRLAATLGPKSSFNKLPKRSVLNADISELCDLIAQPKEPLSLRLSSNLMVGAARCAGSPCPAIALLKRRRRVFRGLSSRFL